MNEKTDVRVIHPGRPTYTKEAQRIQMRALGGETVVVRLGPVIFFCANQDAWMLDPEDGVARCLMRDGQKLAHGITETKQRFLVEWNADYRIEGEVFTWSERDGTTVQSALGYPTRLIAGYC